MLGHVEQQHINVVFQLMGSTSSAFVCFVLPAAFGLRLRVREARGRAGFLACCALLIGGAGLGAIATAITTIGLLTGSGPHSDSLPSPHTVACTRQCQ